MHSRNPQPDCEFALRLRPVPGWSTPAVERLRLAAKVLLRGFGLRAIECRPVPPPASADGPDWQARAASEARDEQRRNPRPYPSTPEERLLDEYTPDS